MKKMFIILGALAASMAVHAELSTGMERDFCFKQNKDIPLAYNCLSAKKEASNKKLDALIVETVERIKANNVGPFNGQEDSPETAGDVYSQRFLEAQKS